MVMDNKLKNTYQDWDKWMVLHHAELCSNLINKPNLFESSFDLIILSDDY